MGIDATLRAKDTNDGICKFTFARTETITYHGRILPPGFRVTASIGFQPAGGRRAAINGDFAMVAGEVNKVIAALRRGGISIVELHNHMLVDDPRLFYLAFQHAGRPATAAGCPGRGPAAQTHDGR